MCVIIKLINVLWSVCNEFGIVFFTERGKLLIVQRLIHISVRVKRNYKLLVIIISNDRNKKNLRFNFGLLP